MIRRAIESDPIGSIGLQVLELEFLLIVTDPDGGSDSDLVTVTVTK